MVSDDEHLVDKLRSEESISAKMDSESEKSDSVDNHEDNSRHHNGIDPSVSKRKKNVRISIESSGSASESDNANDCTKNEATKTDAKTSEKQMEKEEAENEEEEERISGNEKKDTHSSAAESDVEMSSKYDTPPARINMVPMSQLLNSAGRKAAADESTPTKTKNDSVFSISDDSNDSKPSTSRNVLKKEISAIVTTMVTSGSDEEVPLRSTRSSRTTKGKSDAKSARPTRKAAAKKTVIDLSGSSSESESSSGDDIVANYRAKKREINMPDCDLKAFTSARVRVTRMNLPKLLERHDLSEILNHRQKVVVRRKSDGVAEVCEVSDDSSGEKESRTKSKKSLDKNKERRNKSQKEPDERNSDDELSTKHKTKKSLCEEKAKPKRGVIKSSDDDKDKASSSPEVRVKKSKRKKAELSDSGSDQYKSKGRKSDSGSDSADFKPKKRKIVGRSKRNSDASESDSADGGKKPKKSRLKRIKRNSDSSSGDEGKEKDGTSKGRKNIKKIIKVRDLDEETRLAAKEEAQRKKRIEERQKLYNESFSSKVEGDGECHELVLDFNVETKEPLISVDQKLVRKLKPHQAEGVKFMWDACFESVEKINEEDSKGGGCILAHCMGLGKTLQVVALVHTLLSHSDDTKVERVLVICPVSTVLNWVNEFNIWLKHCKDNKDIEIFELSKCKKDYERAYKITDWFNEGGVLIMGYDMFRNLTALTKPRGRGGKKIKDQYLRGLIEPGADLVICDEGHLLKNSKTAISKAVTRIRTLRRIALTGTPLQNNLTEYYCMVQFVKPNLLGKETEYMNRFVNPITNGQYHDSSPFDIQMMKRRSHILHKLLDGCVQRRDYSVLAPFLPPKHEYVLSIRLTPLQTQLYKYYIDHRPAHENEEGKARTTRVFKDFQNLQRIWTHPLALRYNSDRFEEAEQKRRDALSDDEGSLEDFIDDDDAEETSSSGGSDSNEAPAPIQTTNRRTRAMRANGVDSEPEVEPETVEADKRQNPTEWWMSMCAEEELSNLEHSGKLQVFFSILKECEAIGDKVLVFSQSLYSLDVIEQFLSLIDDNTQNPSPDAKLCGFTGSWSMGLDYFRLDGNTPIEARNSNCKSFNSEYNPRARLYLISTRAGGLGINLVAANRVIVFDVSWNPSHDIQSIFRVYRFGQNKPCYIYRFLAMGTMEEKIYERQVTKLAISKRVIDEQQIDRHYKAKDLNELYMTNLDVEEERPQPALPKDLLFADMLRKFNKLIYKYHEQDSLLENKEEETLSKAEIEAAWEDYEQEKTRKPVMQPNYVPQQMPRMIPGSSGESIYGIPTEVMLQLLSIAYKNGNPGATLTTINQNVPALLSFLYDAVARGDLTFYHSLVRLYHNMVPNAYMNPNVPHPDANGQFLPSGMMNGGLAYANQFAAPNHSGVQQPASTAPTAAATSSTGVIEID